MLTLLSILLTLILPVSAKPEAVSVTAKPDQIYLETSDSGQHLNFEFILKNQTDEKLLINKIEVLVFDWFGHIKQGSARVKVGQMVKQGEVIAAIGASGSSLFPHLHYELRNGSGAREVEGLPSYFSNFRRILGARSVNVKKGAINTLPDISKC